MKKIMKAQSLVDKILDECSCEGGEPMDQTDVAFQKDTLFDDPDRMVKDKTDEETSLNPVPNTEQISRSLSKVMKKTVQEVDSINLSKVLAARQMAKTQAKIKTKKRPVSENIKQRINMIAKEGWLTDKAQSLMKKKQQAFAAGNKKGGKISQRQAALADALKP